MSTTRPSVVFILGVMNRSGTNYLMNLLLEYPAFASPSGIGEDYLLVRAELLGRYIEETTGHWGAEARERADYYRELLLRRFGKALLTVVEERMHEGKRAVLKTPRSANLEYLQSMFPEAKALLLMRDGRDVVESAIRTFTYLPAKAWMERWAVGARSMLEFIERDAEGRKGKTWKYLRYEDLFRNTREVMQKVLQFLGEESSMYPWDKLESLPLRGSSTVRGAKEKVHWDPVPRPKDFNPIGRWLSWSYLRRRQFKRIAGAELIRAGYAVDDSW